LVVSPTGHHVLAEGLWPLAFLGRRYGDADSQRQVRRPGFYARKGAMPVSVAWQWTAPRRENGTEILAT